QRKAQNTKLTTASAFPIRIAYQSKKNEFNIIGKDQQVVSHNTVVHQPEKPTKGRFLYLQSNVLPKELPPSRLAVRLVDL
ncbi:hypothetical protein, partial [Enterococcus lactis]|uniref:hypothetical protein n=1 Tax=Enterococcus lactis TaxID=357441 RepID=UPI001B3C61AC